MNNYKKKIYSDEWLSFNDPDVPEYFNPTSVLLDSNLENNRGDKTALIVDSENFTYRELLYHTCRAANGLQSLKL